MAGLFETLLLAGATLAKAAYDDSQVKKNKETDEYKEEYEDFLNDLEKHPSMSVAIWDFHKTFADDEEEGFFTIDGSKRSDPYFMAYMEFFKRRGVEHQEVRCKYCNRRLGYRVMTKKYDDALSWTKETDHLEGRWKCACGKNGSWKYSKHYNGDAYIEFWDF